MSIQSIVWNVEVWYESMFGICQYQIYSYEFFDIVMYTNSTGSINDTLVQLVQLVQWPCQWPSKFYSIGW